MAVSNLGPWSTAFDASAHVQLSRLWRQRVMLLPHSAARSPRVRRTSCIALALVVASAIAAPGFEGMRAADAPVSSAAAGTPPVKPADADKNTPAPGQPIRVELPGGAIAEVVGIGPHPSQDQPWWAPDGRPTATPYARFDNRCGPNADEFVREIAVRWVVEPPGQTLASSILGGGSSGSGFPLDANGKPMKDLRATARAFKKGTKTCVIRFSVANSDWETVSTTDGRSDSSWGSGKYTIAFSKASLRSDGLTMIMAHNIIEENVRIVAVDTEGNVIKASYSSSGGGRGFLQSTASFPRLELEDVKEFRLERRPFRHIEVRNISLEPNELTQPEVVALPDERAASREWSLGEDLNRPRR